MSSKTMSTRTGTTRIIGMATIGDCQERQKGLIWSKKSIQPVLCIDTQRLRRGQWKTRPAGSDCRHKGALGCAAKKVIEIQSWWRFKAGGGRTVSDSG
jgi:hypothetical protein